MDQQTFAVQEWRFYSHLRSRRKLQQNTFQNTVSNFNRTGAIYLKAEFNSFPRLASRYNVLEENS